MPRQGYAPRAPPGGGYNGYPPQQQGGYGRDPRDNGYGRDPGYGHPPVSHHVSYDMYERRHEAHKEGHQWYDPMGGAPSQGPPSYGYPSPPPPSAHFGYPSHIPSPQHTSKPAPYHYVPRAEMPSSSQQPPLTNEPMDHPLTGIHSWLYPGGPPPVPNAMPEKGVRPALASKSNDSFVAGLYPSAANESIQDRHTHAAAGTEGLHALHRPIVPSDQLPPNYIPQQQHSNTHPSGPLGFGALTGSGSNSNDSPNNSFLITGQPAHTAMGGSSADASMLGPPGFDASSDNLFDGIGGGMLPGYASAASVLNDNEDSHDLFSNLNPGPSSDFFSRTSSATFGSSSSKSGSFSTVNLNSGMSNGSMLAGVSSISDALVNSAVITSTSPGTIGPALGSGSVGIAECIAESSPNLSPSSQSVSPNESSHPLHFQQNFKESLEESLVQQNMEEKPTDLGNHDQCDIDGN